jgi:BASS family bile acid:Na+ symporter
MPPELSAGMVLVGSVASGTASNVMIYLAKGDVALSVTISSVSTLVGVVATPLLTRLYVDAHIQVDVMGMLLSILQIVVIPIALGLVIHHTLPKVVKAVEPFLPAFSMVCILAIISAVVAGSASHIASVGLVVIVAVILHNAIGLLGGYWGGRLFGFDESTCRTLAIEVGMQNSGLAAALGKSTSARSPRCPARCFQSGTTCPVRCWRATGRETYRQKREQTLIFLARANGPGIFPVCASSTG